MTTEELVNFVYATFEKKSEMPMGIWSLNLSDICKNFKTWGQINNQSYNVWGDIISIRVVQRAWGKSPIIISENIYNQRDMRRIARVKETN